MPDLNALTCIRTITLTNCRDTLRERADHLQEWMRELQKIELIDHAGKVSGNVCPKEATDFLFELQGDLDDWARALTAQIGDDAE